MMANKKKSGFNGPAIGDRYPKGTKLKRNPDGTMSLVVEKSKKKGSK